MNIENLFSRFGLHRQLAVFVRFFQQQILLAVLFHDFDYFQACLSFFFLLVDGGKMSQHLSDV